MSRVCKIIYDEAACVVHNSFPELEAMLQYRHRSLDEEDGGRCVKEEVTTLFNLLDATPGMRVIQTFQGLVPDIAECCQQHGYTADIVDARLPFVPPVLHRMSGFRFTQRDLVIKALVKNRSGCIGAPTRFGKTTLLINVARAFPTLKTVIAAPGIDLLKQLHDDVARAFPDRKVRGLYTGSGCKIQSEDITVVSLDSLDKCDKHGTKLLLIDEPHSAVSASRVAEIVSFHNARKIGFGATLSGRFDRADVLIKACIGPVLSEVTYREARDMGAVAPIEVAFLRRKFPVFPCGDRDAAYRKLVHNNPDTHKLWAQLCREAIPQDWQTLIFIKNEQQAKGIYHEIQEGTIVMAKLLTPGERRELTEQVKANVIKRCICSDVYSQGVTFHEVRALINAGGGGGSISCVQKPGRLAEIRPGKKCGVVVDVLWQPESELFRQPDMHIDDMLDVLPNPSMHQWSSVVRDCWSRHRVYKDKGYNITYHDTVESLAAHIKSCT